MSKEAEGEATLATWVSNHQQCFHLCGAEGGRTGREAPGPELVAA